MSGYRPGEIIPLTGSSDNLSKYQLVVGEKGWARLMQSLKAITRRTTPSAFDEHERVEKLKEVQRGWLHYFRMASIQGKLQDIDSWVLWQAQALHPARLEEA